MRYQIRNGFDVPLAGGPCGREITIAETRSVGLIGRDYRDLRPSMALQEGHRVRAGETVFGDRRYPEIRVTAPGSGIVREVKWGPRRRLESVAIELNNDPPIEFARFSNTRLSGLSTEVVREQLFQSGQWVALRARPYERIARPDIEPRAIFVTAIDTNPQAPDPVMMISGSANDFRDGVTVIAQLTSGPVYVCTAAGRDLSLPDLPNVSQVEFAGPHPSGLAGTHIHALERVSDVPDLWHIGYQDVIAIGHLFTNGFAPPHRIVAVGGPGALSSRLLRVRAGAELMGLVQPKPKPELRVVSGSILSGHSLPGYLGRYHNQVTLLPHTRKQAGHIAKMAAMILRGNTGLDRAASCAMNGRPGGLLPLEDFDRVWPFSIPPGPLLRALLTGDTDAAIELGCRGLAEEDLALCTYVCVAKYDYGLALRRTLRDIERLG